MRRLIFVGGVHGVGKTFLCNRISSEFNFVTHSASNLISNKSNQEFTNNKRISHIHENQDKLVDAVADLSLDDKVLLQDGHFCLINKAGEIVKVPEVTFTNLSPRGIIVLTDTPQNIFARLSQRDQTIAFDYNSIDAFQIREVRYSKEIAILLNTPIYIHPVTDDLSELYKFIGSIDL